MKKFFRVSMVAILAIAIFSCKKEGTGNVSYQAVTVWAEVSASGVKLSGKKGPDLSSEEPWTPYFLVSEKEKVADDASAVKVDATVDGNDFTGTAKGLVNAKKYFFAAVIEQGGKKYVGASKSFMTAVEKVSLNYQKYYLPVGESLELKATVSPDGSSQKVTWKSSKEEYATVSDGVVKGIKKGMAYIYATSEDGFREAACQVIVLAPVPSNAVHMGTAVYWMKWNVGANSEEQSGKYYAFGEIKARPATGDYEGVYTSPNSGTPYPTLALENDAAYRTYGGNWRMPTKFEAQDLIDNCTLSEDTVKGVKGMRLTSKINGKSIFFPYGGYYDRETFVSHGNSSYLRTSTCEGKSGYRKASPDVISYRNYEGKLSCNVSAMESSGYEYNQYLFYAMNIRAVYDGSK